eukprot:TRINITY_DN16_c0_g2_i1.p1 TRINITY_DN16_c0_g2~~TRINITY_DN16_c0_g2_i1.p1  ORF type:complete len:362 (-),score=92.60 TRINITY_DN16_c0_g2_i1:796-1827(-)
MAATLSQATLLLVALACNLAAAKKHIIFVFADDLGWNDVGYHQVLGQTTNVPFSTPNLDALAASGVKLENYYTQPLCSPSRGALMTGRYPSHTGIGPMVISMQKGYGLPPSEVIIPKRLKEVGYATHMVGKWHLGYCDHRYYPTSRGFDTWFGYSSGMQDYWTHVSGDYSNNPKNAGYDFDIGKAGSAVELVLPKSKYNGTYGLYAHIAEAVSVIKDHGKNHADTPMFMYLALQAVHDPLEVPEKYMTQYETAITNKNHRIYAGMVTAMDEGVGNVTKALKESGLWDNTVLIFASDNGGPWLATANNYPLRGQKATNWEGGIRASAFLTGVQLCPPLGVAVHC